MYELRISFGKANDKGSKYVYKLCRNSRRLCLPARDSQKIKAVKNFSIKKKKKEIVKNKFNTPLLTEELVADNGCCRKQSHISLGAWLLASAHVPVGAHTHVHMISTNWTLGYQ